MNKSKLCALLLASTTLTQVSADNEKKQGAKPDVDYSQYQGENRPSSWPKLNRDAVFKTRRGKTVDMGLINEAVKTTHPGFTLFAKRQRKIAKAVKENAFLATSRLNPDTKELVITYTYTTEPGNNNASYFDFEPFGFSPNDRLSIRTTSKFGSKITWIYSDKGLNGPANFKSYDGKTLLNSDMDYFYFPPIPGELPNGIYSQSRTNHQKGDTIEGSNVEKHLKENQLEFIKSEFPEILEEEQAEARRYKPDGTSYDAFGKTQDSLATTVMNHPTVKTEKKEGMTTYTVRAGDTAIFFYDRLGNGPSIEDTLTISTSTNGSRKAYSDIGLNGPDEKDKFLGFNMNSESFGKGMYTFQADALKKVTKTK